MNKYILFAAMILIAGNRNTVLCYSEENHTQNEGRSKKSTKKQSPKKMIQKNYSVDYMLGFHRGKPPAPCGIQLRKTTREEIIKKFKPKLDNESLSISVYNPSGYKDRIKCIFIYFDENEVVSDVSIDFDDDYFFNFVGRIQNAGYRRIYNVDNGVAFQQKQMPFEIVIRNSLFENLTDVSYRVMK